MDGATEREWKCRMPGTLSRCADAREWLEADGLGGFASGTASGIRTRRYHALLLTATTPPTGRVVLVNGFDAWLETPGGRIALSSQRYVPDVIHPDGASRVDAFATEPWPTWEFAAPDGTRVRQEIVVPRGEAGVVVRWRLLDTPHPREAIALVVRPLLSGRDYHGTHHENGRLHGEPWVTGTLVSWHLYAGLPVICSRANARYTHRPDWFRQFLYTAERERGLDDREDLWSPGELTFALGDGDAVWLLAPARGGAIAAADADVVAATTARLDAERVRRAVFPSRLARAADAYVVARGAGRTIIAGYPWFTDWGRDTFIALRGLCLDTGRADVARAILLEWCGVVSEGMLPNRFPDGGAEPEYNAVDASLWFVAGVGELLDGADAGAAPLDPADRATLRTAVTAIVEGHLAGTRYGIRAGADGLLACGAPGVQLTWMDAKVGDRVVTPRIGKPVEVQVLWLHALACAARLERTADSASSRATAWLDLAARGRARFGEVFWNDTAGCLYDVVDVDHEPGHRDGAIRPNQIFAVGGLGEPLITGVRARSIVDVAETRLWTPMGLRSLAPGEPGYGAHYEGPPEARDAVYHQGTVWPWFVGAFVDAWLRVHADDADAATVARTRFLAPLLAHLDDAGLGHVSEIADAEPPYTPRGCPFQAWSLGELIRAERVVAAHGRDASAGGRAGRPPNRGTLAPA
jgi:predicted glycogen debranching enzyme